MFEELSEFPLANRTSARFLLSTFHQLLLIFHLQPSHTHTIGHRSSLPCALTSVFDSSRERSGDPAEGHHAQGIVVFSRNRTVEAIEANGSNVFFFSLVFLSIKFSSSTLFHVFFRLRLFFCSFLFRSLFSWSFWFGSTFHASPLSFLVLCLLFPPRPNHLLFRPLTLFCFFLKHLLCFLVPSSSVVICIHSSACALCTTLHPCLPMRFTKLRASLCCTGLRRGSANSAP